MIYRFYVLYQTEYKNTLSYIDICYILYYISISVFNMYAILNKLFWKLMHSACACLTQTFSFGCFDFSLLISMYVLLS